MCEARTTDPGRSLDQGLLGRSSRRKVGNALATWGGVSGLLAKGARHFGEGRVAFWGEFSFRSVSK